MELITSIFRNKFYHEYFFSSSEPEDEPVLISSDEDLDITEEKNEIEESDAVETKKSENKKEINNDNEKNTSNKLEEPDLSDTSEDEEENKTCNTTDIESNTDEKNTSCDPNRGSDHKDGDTNMVDLTDSLEKNPTDKMTPSKRKKLEITPKKVLSPKNIDKKLESEKKRKERQLEKEEREKKRIEEKERREKEKELKEAQKKEEREKKEEQKRKEREEKEEQKRKEREEKEEQKRKEREEKEQKRKEKEEKEEQKRKEREMEKLKRQQEIEEKNKEKQKEEEKKQKAAAAFVNFFVPKKSIDNVQEKKPQAESQSLFKDFEVKSDMRLPPLRRTALSVDEIKALDAQMTQQNKSESYLKDLKSGKSVRTSSKTWPYQEMLDDDVVIVEDCSVNLGETILEDKSKRQKFRTKFLKFHENRRPAYYGTWRKKSKFVTGRKPFAEDNDTFNYEEDSDDDWEEEEQGESLNGSDDEEKEAEEDRDEYEVDNEFFVPHGHLSDDEIDDEEKAKMTPESLKMKLKLLNDEFERDIQSKTHKLKPRSIGCIWYNKDGSNIDEATDRYLQPLAIISNGPVNIKKRSEIFLVSARKNKVGELDPEHVPLFLKVIHGNPNKKAVLVDQFVTYMANKGIQIEQKRGTLIRILKQFASWKPSKQKGGTKNKFLWLVNDDVEKKFNVNLALPNFLESEAKK